MGPVQDWLSMDVGLHFGLRDLPAAALRTPAPQPATLCSRSADYSETESASLSTWLFAIKVLVAPGPPRVHGILPCLSISTKRASDILIKGLILKNQNSVLKLFQK